jgi:hypothetical protein
MPIPTTKQITPKQVLDKALGRIQDNSATMRLRALGFLNEILQEFATIRDWKCLQEEVNLQMVDGVISHPADYDKCLKIAGSNFTLTTANQIHHYNETVEYYDGFVDFDNSLLVFPTVTLEVSIRYKKVVPEVEDNITPLLFPKDVLPYLVRAVLTACYEYDDDDRFTSSMIKASSLLKTLKMWDNNQQSMPSMSKYIR